MKKTLVCMVIIISICTLSVLAFAMSASAADNSGTCGDNVTWSFNADTGALNITGTGEMRNYTNVFSVPWHSYNSDIKTVSINHGITSISDYAFQGCEQLTSIIIPNSVTSIGSQAFHSCTNLGSVTIPDSVIAIGDQVFTYCDKLISITVEEGNTVYHSAGESIIETATNTLIVGCKTTIIPEDGSVTTIGDSAFDGCAELTHIDIPDSIVNIGDWAFASCKNLSSIVISNSVKNIGEGAFIACQGLKDVAFEENSRLKTIGDYAFSGCCSMWAGTSTLTEISIPSSVVNIGYGAFSDCRNLIRLDFEHGSKLESIGGKAFEGCIELNSIYIPSGVVSVGADAFLGCTKLIQKENGIYYVDKWVVDSDKTLESITLRSDTVGLAENAFLNCAVLTDIAIPNGLQIIGRSAFRLCNSLTSIKIPSTVKSIGDSAFCNGAGTESLRIESVVFEENSELVSIGEYAFAYCFWLKDISIPSQVTTIGECAFLNCNSLTSVTIPSGLTNIGKGAFSGCNRLVEVYNLSELSIAAGGNNGDVGNLGTYALDVYTSLDETSKLHTTDDGYIFYCNGNTVYLIDYMGVDTELILPNTYQDKNYEIYHHAFWGYDSLINITIPNTITTIGDYAFTSCRSLQTIEIPDSITIIGNWAFADCIGLKEIEIPDSVTVMGHFVFDGCIGLENIKLSNNITEISDYAFQNCSGLTNIVIPSSVTSIGSNAFYGCSSITDLTIPKSVTSIGGYAFDCCSSLIYVEIPYNVESIGYDAFYDCSNLLVIHCHEDSAAHNFALECAINLEIESHIYETVCIYGNGQAHSLMCKCGQIDTQNCSGGTATCTERAVCEVCENPHGDILGHEFSLDAYDDDYHWQKCSRCDEVDGKEMHFGGTATCTAKAKCQVCDNEYGELNDHDYSKLKHDQIEHWYECACGGKSNIAEHAYNDDNVCDACGYEKSVQSGTETPGETENPTDADKATDTDKPSDDKEKSGCSSAIGSGTVILIVAVGCGVTIFIKRKKKIK